MFFIFLIIILLLGPYFVSSGIEFWEYSILLEKPHIVKPEIKDIVPLVKFFCEDIPEQKYNIFMSPVLTKNDLLYEYLEIKCKGYSKILVDHLVSKMNFIIRSILIEKLLKDCEPYLLNAIFEDYIINYDHVNKYINQYVLYIIKKMLENPKIIEGVTLYMKPFLYDFTANILLNNIVNSVTYEDYIKIEVLARCIIGPNIDYINYSLDNILNSLIYDLLSKEEDYVPYYRYIYDLFYDVFISNFPINYPPIGSPPIN